MPTRARLSLREVTFSLAALGVAGLLLGLALTAPSSPSPLALAALAVLVLTVLACAAYVAWLSEPAYIFTVAVVLSPFAGNWEQVGVPGPLAPDRLLLLGGIAAVLLKLRARHVRVTLEPVHYVLGAAVLYAVVSAAVAGTLVHKESLLKLVEAYGAIPFLVFLLAPEVFRTARDRQVLLVGLVVLGLYLGLTVIFEVFGPHQLVFPSYIVDPTYALHGDRGRGPFAEAVTNGFGLFACAVAATIAVGAWRHRGARALAGAAALLCLFGTLLTFERSVWLGVIVATMAGFAVTPRLRRHLPAALALGAVAVLLALAAVPGLSEKVHDRAQQRGPVWDRQNLTDASLRMIAARPLLGFGWAEFASASPEYFRLDRNRPLTAVGVGAHNFFLTYAVELGLPGLLLWMTGLVLGLAGALLTRGPPELEPWRRALVPIAVFFLVTANFVPPNVFPNLMLWLWTGIVWAGRTRVGG